MKKSVMAVRYSSSTRTLNPEKKELRFTSRNIKKYSTTLYDYKEKVSHTDHSGVILEVLSIADKCKCKVLSPQSLLFIKEFYESSPERLNYLRNAPKHVQRQYLATFNHTDNFKEIENFMKVIELSNYSSFLTKLGGKEKDSLGLPYDCCLLTRSTPCGLKEVNKVTDTMFDVKYLLRKLMKEASFRDITPYTPAEGIKKAIEEDSDRIHKHINGNLNYLDNRVVLSTLYVLVENFGANTIEEILEKFYEIDRPFKLGEIVDLTARWTEVKEFPIDWALAFYD